MLYPLKFSPILLPKIWGGHHIMQWYPEAADMDNVGESWVVSGFDRYPSVVSNGLLAGNTLQELLEVYLGDLVGDSVYEAFGETFPLLLKFIDADDDLSVQVHPNDEQAEEMEQSLGKTEMWYVLGDSEPTASLAFGWKSDQTPESVRQAVNDGSLMSLVQSYDVKGDDVMMINAGSVHALKKGIIVAEIQENSDITYRLYDYDRTDSEGKKRDLHVDKSLRVLNYAASANCLQHATPNLNAAVNLAKSPYFTTNMLTIDRIVERDYAPLDSFVIYMCVDGAARIDALDAEHDASVDIRKGEAVLLPACLCDIRISPVGGVKLLEVYIDQD